MDERILEHLKLLNKYLLSLRELSQLSEGEFIKDFKNWASAERFLHLAIESCINIGNRIVSLMQFKKPVQTPETYGDIFIELAKLGSIPHDFVDTMLKMVKFRNRLVHIYWKIEPGQIYKILKENLGDFEKFKNFIVKYMELEKI